MAYATQCLKIGFAMNLEYVVKMPLSKLSCKSASQFLIGRKFEPPSAERRMLQANPDEQAINTAIYNNFLSK